MHDAEAEVLLDSEPARSIQPEQAIGFVHHILDDMSALAQHLDLEVQNRSEDLVRYAVRSAARSRESRTGQAPQLRPEFLGVYVYLPR
ncbi:MAG: hypothetical protein AB1486_12015 [Planctomycetota bacterium]